MLSAKENFLETLRGGKPDAFVNEWEPFGSVFDPLMGITLVAKMGEYVVDGWGTTIYWGEGEPGAMPIVMNQHPHKTAVKKSLLEKRNGHVYTGVHKEWQAAQNGEQDAGE